MKIEVSFSQKRNRKNVPPFLLRIRAYVSHRGGACITSVTEGIRKNFPSDRITLYLPDYKVLNLVSISSFDVKSLLVNVHCVGVVQKNPTSKILV